MKYKNRVILLAGSFTSANVNVMLSIIRAVYDNPEIHIVARIFFKNEILPSEKGVFCHPISSKRIDFLNYLNNSKHCRFLCRATIALLYYVFRIVDNFIPSSLENNIFRDGCNIIDAHEVIQIFSVSDPFYTHRVAYKISKSKNIKWAPVWLDSYSNGFCKKSKLWELSSLYYEKKIFNIAPNIFSLVRTFDGNKLIKRYEYKLKYIRIPYIREIVTSQINKNIIYAGLLGDANRNPIPVLDLFLKAIPSIANDIIFHFYVRTPDDYRLYQKKSNNRIQFHPFVTRTELVKILSESFMLINIGNAISFQLPSKVIENISYRKPILFLYSQKNDPSFDYFKDYPDIFIQDINDVTNDDVKRFVNFLNKEHKSITYKQLMKYHVYRECTPMAIKEIFQG